MPPICFRVPREVRSRPCPSFDRIIAAILPVVKSCCAPGVAVFEWACTWWLNQSWEGLVPGPACTAGILSRHGGRASCPRWRGRDALGTAAETAALRVRALPLK
jgi:hypothetical protein